MSLDPSRDPVVYLTLSHEDAETLRALVQTALKKAAGPRYDALERVLEAIEEELGA